MLAKPFAPAQLVTAVAQLLNAGTAPSQPGGLRLHCSIWKIAGQARNRCRRTLLTHRSKLERTMKYVLSLMAAVVVLGSISARADEIEPGMSLASLHNSVTVGSVRDDRGDNDRNMARVKEGEFESPEMIAVIENNREDRERTVVIDR
jgi:hypothetical protein